MIDSRLTSFWRAVVVSLVEVEIIGAVIVTGVSVFTLHGQPEEKITFQCLIEQTGCGIT
jgi:hypothetical protein